MRVLGIESSCDETAAAIVEDGRRIRSSAVASQVSVHRSYGGVVPELASREHIDNICVVVDQALEDAEMSWKDIDAVAVTRGPGLVGALLVGLAYAKAAACARGIPFLGVNHLEGHIYSVFLDYPKAELPALSLVVSGGHTNLYLLQEIGRYELIAKSRDDAAGEALDKLAKYLGLGYPGGPVIEQLAREGDASRFTFTLPKITDGALDFSFSGLKTAALREVRLHKIPRCEPENPLAEASLPKSVLDLAAGFQAAIIDQLLDRVDKAREDREVGSVHLSGGVSCNRALRSAFTEFFRARNLPVYYPHPSLTTDNAAMIAAAGYLRLCRGDSDPWDLAPDPNLALA
ncbi:MAG: tRNA (adenosine(37)-N6)-threonylcarbamoyltransferase complex transferase subunit TsaD [Acidobacteriota bacterium]